MAKGLAIRAAKLAVQGIKTRRQGRVNSGKKVAGQKVRNRLLRAGVNLPIKRQMNAPVAVGTMARTGSTGEVSIEKTELTVDLLGQTTDHVFVIMLQPDTTNFPQLFSSTESNQYFRFYDIDIDYQPRCGTSTSGQLAISTCASYEQMGNVKSYSDVIALNNSATYCSVYAPMSWRGDKSQWDQTHWQMGWRCQPLEKQDPMDPANCQGFIVYSVTGCPNGTDTIGSLTIHYRCGLLRPCAPTSNPAIEMSVSSPHNTVADWVDDWVAQNDFARNLLDEKCPPMPYALSVDGANLKISGSSRNEIRVDLFALCPGVAAEFTSAALVNCTKTIDRGYNAVGASAQSWLIVPTARTWSINVGLTGLAGCTNFHCILDVLPNGRKEWIADH